MAKSKSDLTPEEKLYRKRLAARLRQQRCRARKRKQTAGVKSTGTTTTEASVAPCPPLPTPPSIGQQSQCQPPSSYAIHQHMTPMESNASSYPVTPPRPRMMQTQHQPSGACMVSPAAPLVPMMQHQTPQYHHQQRRGPPFAISPANMPFSPSVDNHGPPQPHAPMYNRYPSPYSFSNGPYATPSPYLQEPRPMMQQPTFDNAPNPTFPRMAPKNTTPVLYPEATRPSQRPPTLQPKVHFVVPSPVVLPNPEKTSKPPLKRMIHRANQESDDKPKVAVLHHVKHHKRTSSEVAKIEAVDAILALKSAPERPSVEFRSIDTTSRDSPSSTY